MGYAILVIRQTNMIYFKKFLLFCSSLFLFACNENPKMPPPQNFDAGKWATRQGQDYPFRNAMLDDVVAHYAVHGVRQASILQWLGQPDRTDSSYLFYRITQSRMGFFPISTKSLVIKFTEDSLLEWRKIHQ